jgi:hypothetical protein
VSLSLRLGFGTSLNLGAALWPWLGDVATMDVSQAWTLARRCDDDILGRGAVVMIGLVGAGTSEQRCGLGKGAVIKLIKG